MKRELGVILCMCIAFVMIEWLTDAPAWVALMAALISGMWADLRMGR